MKKIILTALVLALFISSILAKFAIYGDTRTQDAIHEKVVLKIAAHNPPIAFHSGDLGNNGAIQEEYDNFHRITDPLYQVSAFYPAKGNHEKNAELFLQNFPQLNGRSYYSVRHDGIIFLVLDSTLKISAGSDQYKWLQESLIQSADSTKIVILHHPIFSSGRHGDELGISLFLPQLFAKHNVAAVFSGHDHCYERSLYEGIHFVVTGGGGAPLYDQSSDNRYSKLFLKTHHYIIAEIEKQEIVFRVYDLEDKQIDTFKTSLSR